MNYRGRIIFVSFSVTVSTIESFIVKITLISIAEALFFALIAFFVGWFFDRSFHYRKRAEISEKQFRSIIENSPEPILIYHKNTIVFVNNQLAQLLGLDSKQIIGMSIMDFILPDYHPSVQERIQQVANGDENINRAKLKIYGKQSSILDIEVASIPIIYDHKPSIEVFIKDVTERKRLEEKSRKDDELYRFITENSSDVISYINPNGYYEYLSPSCTQIFGYIEQELVGENIFHFFHTEELNTIGDMFNEAKDNFDFGTFPHRFRKKDGTYVWLETNARTIRNNKKELVGIVAVSRDITERVNNEKELQETNETLMYLSKMDGLTDIPNRRFFEETLINEWEKGFVQTLPLSALMIDIDNFKNFNDQYGHRAGDVCIQQIAKAIESSLINPRDFVARYGGEEFVVLLPEVDRQKATQIGENILQNVRDLNIETEVSEVAPYVTVSIGCATMIPDAEKKPDELIKLADKQLYVAKEYGRYQVV